MLVCASWQEIFKRQKILEVHDVEVTCYNLYTLYLYAFTTILCKIQLHKDKLNISPGKDQDEIQA